MTSFVIAKAEAWLATCSSLSPKSNPISVYSFLRSVPGSSFSSSSFPNFPNCSSPQGVGFLLFNSRLRFNPTPTFLGVTFDRTLSFSKHVSSLKAKFFPRLKALCCISASSWGPSLFCINLFFSPFSHMPHPDGFLSNALLVLPNWNAITGCLSSSPIPLLLSEASLPPPRVTLTHFTLSSYKQGALRLPTFFPISGLARLGVIPRLCRSSWRAFASTHPLMLPSTCSREALLACPPCSPWNLPSFTVESTLSSPCSRSDLPHSRQGAALAHLDSLPPLMIWYSGQTALFLFLLAKAASEFLPTALTVAPRPLFPSQQVQYAQVYLLKPAPFCTLFAGLGNTSKSAFLFSPPPPQTFALSSPLCPFLRLSFCNKLFGRTVFSVLLYYQTAMDPRTLVSPGKRLG